MNAILKIKIVMWKDFFSNVLFLSMICKIIKKFWKSSVIVFVFKRVSYPK